jgi:hypothetical protein
MGTAYNPRIVTDGLILCLDAGNPKNAPLTSVEYLIVAGGGGGGGGVRFSGGGGGGGGGGVLAGTTTITAQSYTVTVGGGGTAAGNVNGTNGGNSSFNGITASGGGGGGKAGGTTQGLSGGSGGGSGGTTPGNTSTAGTGTAGQGNDGGAGSVAGTYNGGGGGGAGAVGNAGSVDSGGGNGTISSITGVPTYYGGGGAGGAYQTTGTRPGGLGGGGDSGRTDGSSGTANTGGGGGGSGIDSNSVTVFTPGSGGSGIVIIRYPGPQRATGGTVTTVGNDIVHTFTGNGTFTVLPAYTNNQAFDWVTDLSGNNKHGTPVNGPTFSTSNGGSFVFDGVNDYVNLGSTSNYFTTGSVSHSLAVSIWVKSTVTDNHIFFGNQQISNERIYISKHENTWDIGWGEFSWSTANITSGSRKAATSNWTHLTMNVSAGVASLYVNGEFTFNRTDTSVNLTGTLPLGAYIFQGNIDTGNLKSNTISSCTIYNRALTAQEISQNFQATRGRYGI